MVQQAPAAAVQGHLPHTRALKQVFHLPTAAEIARSIAHVAAVAIERDQLLGEISTGRP